MVDRDLNRAALPPDWPAPAKLNLFLHVRGRRPDGYHELQTLFQFLDFGDRLRFSPNDHGLLQRHGGLPGLAAEDDLALRAAAALQRHAGTPCGATIRIVKRLPAGGGLGGGSSDAATTLVALNALWGLGLEPRELAGIGASLGADVPVFVHGTAAFAEGRGERLTPAEPPEPWYLVLDPGVAVPTARMFAAAGLRRDCPPVSLADFLAGTCSNVFQPLVLERYPQVAAAHAWLTRFARARLTGTGACLFAAFDTRAEARSLLARIPRRWRGFVARGRNRSPLLDALGRIDSP